MAANIPGLHKVFEETARSLYTSGLVDLSTIQLVVESLANELCYLSRLPKDSPILAKWKSGISAQALKEQNRR